LRSGSAQDFAEPDLVFFVVFAGGKQQVLMLAPDRD
jgi:hypothetical protein